MTLSLKTRWTISIAVSVAASLIILGYTTLNMSKREMDKELLLNAENNLTSQKALVKSKITAYFDMIEKQLTLMAKSQHTIQAANDFSGSYYQYSNSKDSQVNSSNVKRYYDEKFATVYFETTNTQPEINPLASKLSASSLALQADYIATNKFDLGAKDTLNKTGNGTDYDKVHGQYHPDFAAFVDTFEFYDLFIVDAVQGDVIYSVFKEIDFATNLNNGSFSQSGLAQAYREGKALAKGEFFLTDFSAYMPSYEAPAGFVSTPIFDDNNVIAVLILQMPIDAINHIMTQNQKWGESGFGQSGEVYLVGPDKTLRSQSRFYVEDPAAYLALFEEMNAPETQSIKAKGTTITLQKVDSVSATRGLAGETGFGIIEDYRGVNVLSTYSPIKLGNLSWAIISEIDEEEAFKSARVLEKNLAYITLIAVVVLTTLFVFIALFMTSKLIGPIVKMGEHFQSLTSGDTDLTIKVPRSTIPEINTISHSFNIFIEQLRDIINDVKASALTLAAASEELSVSTEQSSRVAQHQQTQAQEVMLAIDEFNTSVKNVSEHSNAASKGMAEAKERTSADSTRSSLAAKNITLLVSEVNDSAATILQLKNEVQNINQVLMVINGIADQTNLLALNAAIEAARAGEHGRGFSVVADEVRTLASSTQKSTVDIQDKIKTLTAVAENAVASMERASHSASQGVELVQDVSNGLDTLTQNIQELSVINQRVATTSSEQTKTSQQISQNIYTVSSASTEMSVAASESKEASQELAHISSNLQKLVERFTT